MFYNYIPGGWPWDFWTINSITILQSSCPSATRVSHQTKSPGQSCPWSHGTTSPVEAAAQVTHRPEPNTSEGSRAWAVSTRRRAAFSSHHQIDQPIRLIGRSAYLPTWLVDFYRKYRYIYNIYQSHGILWAIPIASQPPIFKASTVHLLGSIATSFTEWNRSKSYCLDSTRISQW